eukprot:XP_001699257.1 predicted protein [Chlamydomonas reinhardtii]
MAAVPQQQQSLQEQVARLTADVATLKATMEAQTEQFRAEFQAQIDALQAEEAWLSKAQGSRLRSGPLESLVAALEQCLCVLDASSVAASSASVLLIAGPVLQRLRESIGDIAAALQALAAAVEVPQPRSGEGSDSDGSESVVALLRALRRELLNVPLTALEERVVGCEALRSRLRALTEVQAGEAALEEAVRSALLQAGVPASRLRNPEARSELVAELFDLQSHSAAAAAGSTSGSGRAAASGPLLSEADCDILKTPTPDAQGPGTSSANGSGGAFPSAAANNSGAAAASSGQAQCNAGCVANGMGAGCCDGNGAAGKAAVSSAAAGALLPLQRSLLCPITQLLMRDPVTTAAGHTYERCAIEAWFLNNNTDPTTRQLLTSKALIPSWTVKGAIEEWLAAAGLSHDQYDDMGDGAAAVYGLDGPGLRFILGGANAAGGTAAPASASAASNGAAAAACQVPAAGSSSAYGSFAGCTWEQVADVDAEAQAHLEAARVSAAVARALTDKLGAVTMKELREGAVSETHVLGLGLKALDQRRLLQALVAAGGGASANGAAGSAVSSPAAGVSARLMDYVTVSAAWQTEADALGGPLAPGRYGIVRALQEPHRVWWYTRAALTAVPAASVPPALRLELPVDEDNMGAPVTPWTCEPGMLVRRGYDWRNAADRQGQGGEVGMLAESRQGGRMWRVFWSNGGEGVYATGQDDKYELQHLQVHPFSGAPVVDEAVLTPGCGVVRGLHWTYDNQDGGPGTIGTVQHDDRHGYVAALWPNHRLARYRASTQQGFDLHYCSRPGEPVTVFNAQAGLKVTRGRDWKWEAQDGEGGVGVMIRPSMCAEEGVWWQVAWANGTHNQYRVGRPGSQWCDLQVATYESNGDSGRILPGTPVVLAPDFARFSDAKDGPLRPGKVGVVVAVGGGEARYKVMHLRTSSTWFYDRRALRPLPGCMAVARCKRMKLNREGRAAFLGSDAGGGTGGDTGRSPRAIFYCGAALGQCRCGGCDGRCGPTNGCPCHACAELIGKRLTAEGGLADGGSGGVDPALMQALLALAVLEDDDE